MKMKSTKQETMAEDLPGQVKEVTEEIPQKQDADKPKLPQYDKEELLMIFDEIIFSGEYTEDLMIKNKLKISFRTRSAQETTEISRAIDGKNFSLMATLQEYRALLNLAYSLVGYAGKDFSKASVEDKQKFIGGLPSSMVALLSNKLADFDLKVDMACKEGETNF